MQDDRYPFAPPPLPGDTARPRRRRTRGHGKARTAPEQTAQAGSTRPAARAAAPVQPPQQSAPPQREGGSRSRRRGGTVPAGADKQAAPAAQAPQRSGSARQAPAPRAPQQPSPQRTASAPQTAARRAAPAPAAVKPEDPGLLLIARRPPKQKYANFEEYITAHGGVTAPLPEPEE